MRDDVSLANQPAAPAGQRLGRLLPPPETAAGGGPGSGGGSGCAAAGGALGAGGAGPPWLRVGSTLAESDLRDLVPDDTGADEVDAATADEIAAGEDSAGGLGRLVGHAFDPGRPGLRALAVVAATVVLVAAGLAWWSRPRPEPVTAHLISTAPAAPGPTEPAQLVVAVTGEVLRPGLVHLPPGARVADAIEAAGGLLPEAEVDHLNLARRLTDGELVAVGVPPPPAEAAGADHTGVGGVGGKVNLNTATSQQLQTLPGIGPALAQRIIDFRTTHGPFTSVGQLREVSGIGETRFAELRELVTV